MTKTDRVRALLAQGLTSREISERTGASVARIGVIRWQDARPGYQARFMAKKRAEDRAYYERELDQQATSRQRKKREARARAYT